MNNTSSLSNSKGLSSMKRSVGHISRDKKPATVNYEDKIREL